MVERRLRELDTKLQELSQRRQDADPKVLSSFQDRLITLWLYHDQALEGVALSGDELQDALSHKTFADRSQDTLYQSIRDHKRAIDLVQEQGQLAASHADRPGLVTIPLLKRLHELLTPEDRAEGHPYRTDRLLHRLYHHAIVPATQIAPGLRKLCESVDERHSPHHPVLRATQAHFELMTLYPWPDQNGPVARLLMNLLLLRDGYPPAIIRGVERQRYHESLRAGSESLLELVVDSLDAYCTVSSQFLDAQTAPKRSR